MPFTGLLLTARKIEFHSFTACASSKSATGGSLKARCPFSPMPRQQRSMGCAPQEPAVALAFIQRQQGIALQIMKTARLHARFNALPHVTPETRRMLGVNAKVFVHVKNRHARPIDAAQRDERIQNLICELPVARMTARTIAWPERRSDVPARSAQRPAQGPTHSCKCARKVVGLKALGGAAAWR